jgi:pilus assembly protein CpaC
LGRLKGLVAVFFIFIAFIAFIGAPGSARSESLPDAFRPEARQAAAPSVAPSEQVRLKVNQSILVDSPDRIKRVSVARPEVADVMVVSPTQMLVSGKGAGMTTLIYWSEGDVPRIVDLVVDPYTEQFRDELRKLAPDADFEISASGDSLFLSGTVRSEAVRNRLAEGAGIFARNVVNLLEIEQLEQILLQVRVAEVDRSVAKELGFNAIFQPVIDGGMYRASVNAPNSFSPFFGELFPPPGQPHGPNQLFDDTTNLFVQSPGFSNAKFSAFLRILHDRGAMKMLAEPNLVVASGGEGRFLVGGEFPIVYATGVGGATTFSVEYKEFGVKLDFQPRIVENGEIFIKIAQEMSDLDFANAVILSGFRIPALRSRKAESDLQLADGQTFVMAGLIDNKVARQVSKVPFLGDIPILGALFRNVRYSNSETELMVLITPNIVRPLSPEEIPALPTETMPPEETHSGLLP